MRPSPVPERVLRHIWQHRLYPRPLVRAVDGRSIEVFFPGDPNPDSGPDFLEARLRIGTTLYSGAVEIHSDSRDWERHGHHVDPKYNTVVLHVVLTAETEGSGQRTASGRQIPILALAPFLDPMTLRIVTERGISLAGAENLACSAVNTVVPRKVLLEWLACLGRRRLERSAGHFRHRLCDLLDEARHLVHEPDAGVDILLSGRGTSGTAYAARDFVSPALWDQALYEGLMEGLGYAKNRGAFRTLARTVPLALLRRIGLSNTHDVMAAYFGAARLLPFPEHLDDPEARSFARSLWERWSVLRPLVHPSPIHETDWLFFRLRPANFPTARIAAWSTAVPRIFERGFAGYLAILRAETVTPGTIAALRAPVCAVTDGFWRHRLDFHGMASAGGSSIGAARATELVVNAVLPLASLFGSIFPDDRLAGNVRTLWESPFRAPSSRLLALLESDLFRGAVRPESPLLYQGAVELFTRYCTALRCTECAIGSMCGMTR